MFEMPSLSMSIKVCHEFVQQCKKKPRSYQLCCIEATGDVLDALKMNIGSYIDFKDVLLPIVRDEVQCIHHCHVQACAFIK